MSVVWGLEAQTGMQKRLADAHVGYLRMNIVEPVCGAAAWGKYNNRGLSDRKVQELRSAFHRMGVLSCQQDKVIYLPMDTGWYEGKTSPEIAGKYIYELPELKLTAEGEAALKANLIHPCSGNHRRAATVLYYTDLVEAKKELLAEIESLEGDERSAKEEELLVMEKRVEHAPFWAVLIYDLSELVHLIYLVRA